MLLIASSLALGQYSALHLFPTPHISRYAFIAVFLVICFASVAFFRRAHPVVICILISLATFCLGAGRTLDGMEALSVSGGLAGSAKRSCEGRLLTDPVKTDAGCRLDIELIACRGGMTSEDAPAGGAMRLYARGRIEELEVGDRVRFYATIRNPRDFLNPGGFSHRLHLAARGIGAIASLSDPRHIVRTGGGASGLAGYMADQRRKIVRSIDAHVEGPSAYLVKAVAVGWRDGSGAGLRDDFSRTGIAHLLAISGLHVGFVALIAMGFFGFFLKRCRRLILRFPLWHLSAALALPVAWLYVVMAGQPVSAVRAAIMLTVLIAGWLFGRRQDLLSTLAAAALVIMVVWPLAIADVSFQLSVVTVWGIIVITPRLAAVMEAPLRLDPDRRAGRAGRRAVELVAVTVAATISSAPIVAYHFHFVTGVGLIANVIAVPLAGFLLVPFCAAASLLTLLAPALSPFAWQATAAAASLIVYLSSLLAPLAETISLRLAPGAYEVLFAYALIACVVFWHSIPLRKLAIGGAVAFILVDGGYWYVRPIMGKNLEVTFLDVGQGEAAVVRFPGGSVWVIDGGGIHGADFDVGRHVVAPALLSAGIRRVDALVLSHPHHDHYRGLGYLARRFSPSVVLTNGADAPEEESDEWREFKRSLAEANVPVKTMSADVPPFKVGDVDVSVLHPRAEELGALDLNDSSLVISLRLGKVGFLFTGDLMDVGEGMLLGSGRLEAHRVLKLGHHGSDTSSTPEFLDVVSPSIAVISVGAYNRYGMPGQAVLDRLREREIKIYRTDRDGAITISTDGKEIKVDTFVK